ncbi:uncharacterized protein LOC103521242 [Diaphorina citri]|uniref:Uncharacterized protein LOC103508084 n=1 Tax=Diaphorina citri TaxID=121845 RepID=A0A1S3DM01_DIACI|nr:uncharacterized protein LOC103508084 [Diaphorina citri]XP_008484570.1 uncharacterized protein LOC103521242 [Diaphorina citri]KAI5723366.1 hypothetical protein M8J76_005107 [Diaphorina citri]KAI5727683.1 hypothetical protein M8J77_005620 [Diaphorina citri]KAI5733245.1 hypothetical protein M8J76_009507 [Diaphorina citri]
MPTDKNDKLSDRELILKMNKDLQELLPMRSKMNQILELVKEQNKKIEQLETQLNEQRQENKHLTKNLANAKDEINDLQQRSRLSNIIINGIPEAKGENVFKLVEDLGRKLEINNAESHIQVAHRVKTTNKTKAKPIVVRLLNSKTRDIWTAAYRQKKLWAQKIYVNEHLTKKNQDLLHQAKEFKSRYNFNFVWVRDCKIFIRKNDKSRVFVIRSELDFERVLGRREVLPQDGDVSSLSNF